MRWAQVRLHQFMITFQPYLSAFRKTFFPRKIIDYFFRLIIKKRFYSKQENFRKTDKTWKNSNPKISFPGWWTAWLVTPGHICFGGSFFFPHFVELFFFTGAIPEILSFIRKNGIVTSNIRLPLRNRAGTPPRGRGEADFTRTEKVGCKFTALAY